MQKLIFNGLSSTAAANAVNACINGSTQTYFREDGDEYKIRVRYAPEFRQSMEDIEDIVIYNSRGQGVKVKDLGTVEETLTPPTIERKNRDRYVQVSAIVGTKVPMSKVVKAAETVIAETDIPTDVSVVISGDDEDQKDMFRDMTVLLVLIIILV